MPFQFRDGTFAGTCSVCGAPSWSPRSNKCADHKSATPYKSKSKKAKAERAAARRSPSVASDGGPITGPVTGPSTKQYVEAAGEITSKTFSGKPPTASEWEEKLTALVVLGTMTYVEYVVVRPVGLSDADATQAVAILGMTDEEARTIVEPCSYLLGRSELNKKHGREAIEILAFAPALLAIVSWADRVSQFRQQMQVGDPNVSTQRFEAAPGASETTGGPVIANFRGVTDPGQAPTARVNGDGAHLDRENGLVS